MEEQGPELDATGYTLARYNGIVTVTNTRTGAHQTFKVTTALGGSQMDKRLVGVLIGPDPEAFPSWTTFGVVIKGQVQLWRRWDTRTYQGYARLLERPAHYAQRGYAYRARVRCRRCNGPLRDARSLTRGLDGLCQAYRLEGDETP
jgi:hypothetical protein